jgi:hypothetical protein
MDSTGAHLPDFPRDPATLMAQIDDGPWNALLSHAAYRLLARLVRYSADRGWETSHTLANSTLGDWLGKSARQGRRVRDELGTTDLLTVTPGVYRSEGSEAQSATLTVHLSRFAQGSGEDCAPDPATGERVTSVPNTDPGERDTYVPIVGADRDTYAPNDGGNGSHMSRSSGHICPHMDTGETEGLTDARETPVRPMGRASLPNHYPLDYADGVVDRASRLASWAMGPPLTIRHGGSSSEWRDVCAEFVRLDIPDSDIQAKLVSRTAAHVREKTDAGEEPDPIHSLVYHAAALTQWAQTYDPAAKTRAKQDRRGKPTGFVSSDDEDHQADAEAWRARRAGS